jgi:Protein of unknown function (DUF2958)
MTMEKLFTKPLLEKLLANNAASQAAIAIDGNTPDHKPVLKLFTPFARCTWLLTEYDAETQNAFGLCDLGFGCPEIGSVHIPEILSATPVERDRYWQAKKTLSAYADEARNTGAI